MTPPPNTLQSALADRYEVVRELGQGEMATEVRLTGGGGAQFAVAEGVTVAYVPDAPRSLVLVDRSGSAHPATAERRNHHMPQFSSDGRRILTDFTSADGRDVWIVPLDGGVPNRVTFDRDGHDATWEPDGRSVTYTPAAGVSWTR